MMSVGFILETLLLPLGWQGRSLFLLLGFHLVAVAFLCAGFLFARHIRNTSDKDRSIQVFSIMVIAFFPMIGIFGVFLLWFAVYVLGHRFHQGVYEEYEKYILERSADSYEAKFRGDITRRFREEVSFRPFADIMSGREIMTKAKVIKKLARSFSRESVLLLKTALKDESADVRLYAATALLKMEEDLNEKIQRVVNTVKREGTAQSYSDLGDLYRSYAGSGLLEPNLARYYLKLGGDAYRGSLDIDTGQPVLLGHYVKCLIELGEYDKAKVMMDRAVTLWPGHTDLNFLRNEIYFNLGRFEELNASFQKMEPQDLDEKRKEVFELWKGNS